METLFLKLLNMSINASILVLIVLLLRLIFKKAPKWINCILWALVGIRLVIPFSFESRVSLIPRGDPIPANIVYQLNPQLNSPSQALNEYVSNSLATSPYDSASKAGILLFALGCIWLIGLIVMILYSVISYAVLRGRLRTATLYARGIKQSDSIDSPFVLGVIKPTIYIPYSLSGQDLEYVLSHERAHIRRKDYLWKPIGFLTLSVHWFNPVVWIAFIMLCRDIEAACDEKVISELDETYRKEYSLALLNCSVKHRLVTACPVAFGETGVKSRIRGIMNYKKPAFWIIIIAIIACIVVGICFITNPQRSGTGVRSIEKDEFINILEHDLKLEEDKEPFMYSLSGRDYGIYRIIDRNDNVTQINGFWGDSDICYTYFPVSSLAEETYELPHRLYGEEIDGSVADYTTDEYEYFIFDGYFEGTYNYGAIFHVDNMILQIYTNEDSDAARENTVRLLSLLEFPAFSFPALDSDTTANVGGADRDDRFVMRATVTEAGNGFMLVTPVEGSWELSSSDCFNISLVNIPASPEPVAGDVVEIEHNGVIQELYPASFLEVFSITVISGENSATETTEMNQIDRGWVAGPNLGVSNLLGYSHYEYRGVEYISGVHYGITVYSIEDHVALGEWFGFGDCIDTAPEMYAVDIDGDGNNELICNCQYGADGVESCFIFRNNNGVIEYGYVSQEYLCNYFEMNSEVLFPTAGSLHSNYDSNNNVITVVISDVGEVNVSLNDSDAIEYLEYTGF